MRQTEYLLKGLYLGLVFFAALQQAEASPAGSWDSLARVNLSALAGLGLALGLAAVAKLREGYRVKGRLQYLVQDSLPRALQRNYALRSFGSATRAAVEGYVADQLGHHPMVDERVQARLRRIQLAPTDVDLTRPRPEMTDELEDLAKRHALSNPVRRLVSALSSPR